MLKERHIVEEILKKTKEDNFDLIVIGAKGMSKMKEFFLDVLVMRLQNKLLAKC